TEFRFRGHPIEPLQTLDARGRVVYIGSFSKTMLPTLRLAFIVTPPSLGAAVRRAKQVSDWHTALPLQVALAKVIEGGEFSRHIRKMRNVYKVRHEIITETLITKFADHLEVIPSIAGLHIAGLARAASAEEIGAVVHKASEAGVAIQDLSTLTAAK